MEQNNNLNNDEIERWKRLISDPQARQEVACKNPGVFYYLYRSNQGELYDLADFQKEILGILQDRSHTFFVLEGARGSGKTTLAVYMNAIWAIVGEQQLKYVVIITRTNEQARMCMSNIKYLMLQEPLHSDMGPFAEVEGEWRSTAIDIIKYGARIAVFSLEQQIRGTTHHGIRPQLVIADDLENYTSAKSPELREKTYQTFFSDIVATRDKNTRFVVIGTRLHEQSLIMRLKSMIENNLLDGIFRSYPIMRNDKILWPEKYIMEDILKLKHQTDPMSWMNEYMLKLIPPEDQIIKQEWIKYWKTVPDPNSKNFCGFYVFIDPAFSENNKADCTAMVTMPIYRDKSTKQYTAYVIEVVNRQMSVPATISECKRINNELQRLFGLEPIFVIEGGSGLALGQMLKETEKLKVKMINPGNRDKRFRLYLASRDIENSNIMFQENDRGCETLIRQVVNFGSERFDDACDALTLYTLLILLDPPHPPETPRIIWLDMRTGEIT